MTAVTGTPLLEVEHLTMRFGGLVAVNDVSFTAMKQQITAVIGPNGAGKTTMFNCLTGFYSPTVGRLALHRDEGVFLLERLEAFRISQQAAVARTFQNIRLFAHMSVLENLIVAQHNKLMKASGFTVAGLLGLPVYRKAEKEAVELARYWLDKVKLTKFADWEAGNLPYGAQRRLEIARALATEPKLLCLDEPAAGFNPSEKSALIELIHAIREDGYTVLLIEHDMGVVMDISHRIMVLDFGKKIAEGYPEEVLANAHVKRAYLGEADDVVSDEDDIAAPAPTGKVA